VTELARGLYRFADSDEFEDPDLAVVAARAPDAVVCLISALSYHGITTQVPAVMHLAVPRGTYHALKLDPLPVQVYRFDPKTFASGIEQHDVGGVKIKIYSAAWNSMARRLPIALLQPLRRERHRCRYNHRWLSRQRFPMSLCIRCNGKHL
jgi:hypothetical protein